MPAISPPAKVLVTGANGYIAAWAVKDLLDHGYSVRGTVRSFSKVEQFNNEHFSTAMKDKKLEFVEVPDIAADGAFNGVVKGVDAILHIATPLNMFVDPDSVIEIARKSTVGVLESAKIYGTGIKRIAITSSCAAVQDEDSTSGIFNEENWNDASLSKVHQEGVSKVHPLTVYRASKVSSERAAWEFVKKHEGEITWDLTTLCPSWVFGPVAINLSTPKELTTSIAIFYNNVLVKSPPPQAMAKNDGWIEVRDCARAHVLALEVPEAGGERFILSFEEFHEQDWFDIVNTLGVPGFAAPKGIPGAGIAYKHQIRFENTKIRTILGMRFRNKETTVKDIIEDFRSRGWANEEMSNVS